MNDTPHVRIDDYISKAETWQADRDAVMRRDLRIAWMVAAALGVVAVFEAVALVALTPLKTVVPYTLLVDRQTGYVEALKPLERQTIAPDQALTRSFLAQYVLTRESFDINSLNADYKKVALWSSGEARDQYVSGMQATNPRSPLASLPKTAVLSTQIKSISSLGPQTSLIRFVTRRDDLGAEAKPASWQAVVTYRFSGDKLSAADRMTNPLGFQVTRYRRNAELAPEDTAVQMAQPMPPPIAPQQRVAPQILANPALVRAP